MNGGPGQQKGTVADPFAVANTGHPQDPFASAPYQSAPDTPDPEDNPWMAAGTHALNIAQGLVPGGMRAFEAFMGMLGSHIPGNTPMTYPQSLATLDQMTGTIPNGGRAAEQILGGLPLASGKAVLGGIPMLERAMEGRNLLAASPVLAGAELGAASGALNADPESIRQRIEGTLTGGLLGAAAGGLAHGLTGAGGMVARYFKPEIGVRAAARGLLEPADVEAMRVANEIAPGGVSVATAAVPKVGTETSRFLPMAKLTAGSPWAGMLSEHAVLGQQNALDAAERQLGDQMNKITGNVPVTPKIVKALEAAQELLGKKAPVAETEIRRLEGYPATERMAALEKSPPPEGESGLPTSLREAIDAFRERSGVAAARRAGTTAQQTVRSALERHGAESSLPWSSNVTGATLLEPHPGMPTREEVTQSVPIQDLRDALSRLRYHMRALESRGPNAPGITTRDYANAINGMTDAVYEHAPVFANLDRQYSIVKDHQRAASDILETIQKARANQGGVSASGKEAESLGASLHGHPTFYMHFRNLITNPRGTADAVRRLVVQPGGPELMANLLKPPVTTPADLARYSLLAANPLVPHP